MQVANNYLEKEMWLHLVASGFPVLRIYCVRKQILVIVFVSNSSSFAAFTVESAFVELPVCFLSGGPLCCHLTSRPRVGNHDSRVLFLYLLLICCDLESRSCTVLCMTVSYVR